MNIKERILQELRKENYLSDRELTDRILGTGVAQQSVNTACRQLACSGLIRRTAPPIKNYSLTDKDTSTHPTKTEDLPHRGQYLKSEFNAFWNAFWNTEKDYYSAFTLEELVKLKMAITNINNLITFESTIMACNLICDILKFDEVTKAQILHDIKSTSANTNGYDIEHCGQTPFICEVKANIPSGGKNSFGAQQTNQLIKDVNCLLNGKTKSTIAPSELGGYYKFLCMYCNDQKTLAAIHHFVSLFNSKNQDCVELWNGQSILKKNRIYLLLVKEEC